MLFYIDESGTGLRDRRRPCFVLSALCVPANEWKLVDDRVTALKQRLFSWARPEDFEIKGRDMRHGERFFSSLDWDARVKAIHDVAQLICELPCRVFAVQTEKRHLPEYISSDDQMYRLAMSRLLEDLDNELVRLEQRGMLMIDMCSDMHSSVQDRRLVDSYRDWARSRANQTPLIELPWFGFSAFYAGLQLADSCAYLIDFVADDETLAARGAAELKHAYDRFRHKVSPRQAPVRGTGPRTMSLAMGPCRNCPTGARHFSRAMDPRTVRGTSSALFYLVGWRLSNIDCQVRNRRGLLRSTDGG